MTRIYISSTYSDLQPFRDAVYRTLRRMEHDVVAMEDMSASEARPLAQCLADIDSCNLFIGIVGWRRGFIPAEGGGMPITRLEYEHARRMPRLMFLLSPAVPWPAEHTDPEAEGPATVHAFRRHIEDAHVASYFENADQLATAVAVAVRKWEIDSGYRPRPAPFVIPEEVRVIEYVPYDRVKLRFRLLPAAAVVHFVFAAVFLGIILALPILTFFPTEHVSAETDGCGIIAFPFFVAGSLFLLIRRRTIMFDFKNGWVKISSPGAIERARPVVHGLELTTRRTRAGWRTRLMYGAAVIGQTAAMPDAESARARLYPFAMALNQQLGIVILDEKRLGG